MRESSIKKQDIQISTPDGVSLAATLFLPLPSAPAPKAAVLISSGTGFPKAFYQLFAAYGASRGFACMTYDYRGIGGSAPADMRGCQADIIDWGTRDAPAALAFLAQRFDGVPIFTLGHSVGGQIIGLMDNHDLASAHAFVAVGNGYMPYHWPRYWPLELLFFYILGPLSLLHHGYIKGPDYWPGASMPRKVFLQWRRWCQRKTYYQRDVDEKLGGGNFAMGGVPIRQFGFADDPVINSRSVKLMEQLYDSANYDTKWIRPADIGVKAIGHSGAFSTKAKGFWPMPFDWFETLIP